MRCKAFTRRTLLCCVLKYSNKQWHVIKLDLDKASKTYISGAFIGPITPHTEREMSRDNVGHVVKLQESFGIAFSKTNFRQTKLISKEHVRKVDGSLTQKR